MKKSTGSFLLMLAAATAAFSQQGRLAGPVAGYVFDWEARALRPVLGLPGAAVVGEKLKLGFEARQAWVAPRQDGAIATGSDGAAHFLRIDSGAVTESAAPGIDGEIQEVFFSPSGTAAVLVSSAGLQVVTGLPDGPMRGATISLGAASGRTVRGVSSGRPALQRLSLAVSDDGAYVLFASGDAVRLLGAAGEDRKLADATENALVAFAPGGHDASIADPKGAGMVVLRDLSGPGARRVISPPEGLPAGGGLAFSADGSRLFLSSAADRAVLEFNVESGVLSAIGCECSPRGLTRMGATFRLNELGSGPLWLLDAGAAQPRTVFVPATSN